MILPGMSGSQVYFSWLLLALAIVLIALSFSVSLERGGDFGSPLHHRHREHFVGTGCALSGPSMACWRPMADTRHSSQYGTWSLSCFYTLANVLIVFRI